MSRPIVSIICAMDEERGIGKDNKLLWHVPQDLKRFKELTLGHPVIMGRKTYESIGRPLPGRTNIIVTRDVSYQAAGCKIVHSIEEAIILAKTLDQDEIFIIGGAQIYAEAIGKADKLYLTIVKGKYNADAFFPEYQEFKKIDTKEELNVGEFRLTFLTLTK